MTTLAQAMTPSPVTITPGSRAIDALRTMSNGGFRHLPVVEDERIWGIVSRGDFKGMEIDRLDEEDHLWERVIVASGLSGPYSSVASRGASCLGS